jgi:hypothetical protein
MASVFDNRFQYSSGLEDEPKKTSIIKIHDSLVFLFDEEYYGYFLDDYDPNLTEHKFRMRSLIFLFNRLDNFTEGFKDIKVLHRIQYMRRKTIIIFILLLLSALPLLFALDLMTGKALNFNSSTMETIGLTSAAVIAGQFFIINLNQSKMEKRITQLRLAKDIKRYLLQENYYWLYKHFVIFDVDRKLNIYLTFMSKAAVALSQNSEREQFVN